MHRRGFVASIVASSSSSSSSSFSVGLLFMLLGRDFAASNRLKIFLIFSVGSVDSLPLWSEQSAFVDDPHSGRPSDPFHCDWISTRCNSGKIQPIHQES